MPSAIDLLRAFLELLFCCAVFSALFLTALFVGGYLHQRRVRREAREQMEREARRSALVRELAAAEEKPYRVTGGSRVSAGERFPV